MLDLKYILAHADEVRANCVNRNVKADVGRVVELAAERTSLIQGLDSVRREQNAAAKRIGQAYDGDARWLEAAESYARAGAVETYPLRHWALAQAARCFQQAGELERARELALLVDTDSPDLMLPQHLSTMLAELRQIPAP